MKRNIAPLAALENKIKEQNIIEKKEINVVPIEGVQKD